ncbi:unnamed protein product, partial [Mesorhabditis belari]|uniref:RING-type E3 ubiquitin-protein ligase PPIL2 n=1 Tax=Mesorhabditis belari TaxID=2138241 RepID=A0AAF3J6V8_9BILA
MGKKQHQKDKLYLTTTEWKESFGGHKDDTGTKKQRADFKRLPINHCSLSFLPFEDPVCGPDGAIFDIANIVPYIKKLGISPVTGKKLAIKDLVHLKFDKDTEGNFRCPVTFRTFALNTHIVAIRPTGNVYSYDAIQELNLKPNHLKDLLTDEPFLRADIITIQDPNNPEKFNLEQFHHVKLDHRTKEQIETEKKEMAKPEFTIRRMNNETREALNQLKKDYVPKKFDTPVEETADAINAAPWSQGQVSAGFTSTSVAPVTHNKAAVLSDETVKYQRVKKNGYVRIVSNHGAINLELFCPKAPKACENFINLCRRGYYNNTRFHRLIKNFMIQGGDPTGTGHGGESMWAKQFEDEFYPGLSHSARGILSMANKGSNTNQSQFFITFRPCKYLDGKHSIFGKVVGGTDTLNTIEKIATEDGTDRPLEDVIFMRAEVFVDPFEEAEQEVIKEREALEKGKPGDKNDAIKKEVIKPKAYGTGIGKYIKPEVKRAATDASTSSDASNPKKKKGIRTNLMLSRNAADLLKEEGTMVGVCCGVPEIDRILGDFHRGLPCGAITEFVGHAGAGKTQLCHQLVSNLLRHGSRAFFIDTEGSFSTKRLLQMLGGENKVRLLKNVLYERCVDHEKLLSVLRSLVNQLDQKVLDSSNLQLVIVDSVAHVAKGLDSDSYR